MPGLPVALLVPWAVLPEEDVPRARAHGVLG